MSFDKIKKSETNLNNLHPGFEQKSVPKDKLKMQTIFNAINKDDNTIIDDNELKGFVSAIDTDGDGEISNKEAKLFLKSDENLKNLSKNDIEEFLAYMNQATENVESVFIQGEDPDKRIIINYKENSEYSQKIIFPDNSYETVSLKDGKIIKNLKNKNDELIKQTIDFNNTTETINFENEKPISKTTTQGTSVSEYIYDENGENPFLFKKILNKGHAVLEETHEYALSGQILTEVITRPQMRTVIVKDGDTLINQETTTSDYTESKVPTEDGFKATKTYKNGDTAEIISNNSDIMTECKYVIKGKEYTANYDGEGHTYVTLQPKEKIEDFCKLFNVTKQELAQINPDLDLKKLKAGQRILVPGELMPDNRLIVSRMNGEEIRQHQTEIRIKQAQINEQAKAEADKRIVMTQYVNYSNVNTWEDLANLLYTREGYEGKIAKSDFSARVKQLKTLNEDKEIPHGKLKVAVSPEYYATLESKESQMRSGSATIRPEHVGKLTIDTLLHSLYKSENLYNIPSAEYGYRYDAIMRDNPGFFDENGVCIKTGKIKIKLHDSNDYVKAANQAKEAEIANAEAKYEAYAKRVYDIVDNHTGNISMRKLREEFFSPSAQTPINDNNIMDFLNAYDKIDKGSDTSLFDSICSETGATVESRKQLCEQVFSYLKTAAQNADVDPVDIDKAQKDFDFCVKQEFINEIGRINTKDMEKAVDFLRGCIISKTSNAKEISYTEAQSELLNLMFEETQQAISEFETSRREEGWAAWVGDHICSLFGCTTVSEMEDKLNISAKDLEKLISCQSEEELKIAYQKIFDVPFDPQKIAGYKAANERYEAALGERGAIQAIDSALSHSGVKNYFETALKDIPEDKRQAIYQSITLTYAEEFAKTHNGKILDVNNESVQIDALRAYLKEEKIALEAQYKKTCDGKTLTELGNDVKLSARGAFGTSDILKDERIFDENMAMTEFGTEMGFDIVMTIALSFVPAAGEWAAAKTAATMAKWGTRLNKLKNFTNLAKYSAKAENILKQTSQMAHAAQKIQQTNNNVKMAASLVNTGTGTAIIDYSNLLTKDFDLNTEEGRKKYEAAKEGIKEKILMNMGFAGIGTLSNITAPQLVKILGITDSALANEIAEQVLNSAGSASLVGATGGEYGTGDALIDIASGMIMSRFAHITGNINPKSKPSISDKTFKPAENLSYDAFIAKLRKTTIGGDIYTRADGTKILKVESEVSAFSSAKYDCFEFDANGNLKEITKGIKNSEFKQKYSDLDGATSSQFRFAGGKTEGTLGATFIPGVGAGSSSHNHSAYNAFRDGLINNNNVPATIEEYREMGLKLCTNKFGRVEPSAELLLNNMNAIDIESFDLETRFKLFEGLLKLCKRGENFSERQLEKINDMLRHTKSRLNSDAEGIKEVFELFIETYPNIDNPEVFYLMVSSDLASHKSGTEILYSLRAGIETESGGLKHFNSSKYTASTFDIHQTGFDKTPEVHTNTETTNNHLLTMEQAKQICSDERLIKLATNADGQIDKNALELSVKFKKLNIDYSDTEFLLEQCNGNYEKVNKLIEKMQSELDKLDLEIRHGRVWIKGLKAGEYPNMNQQQFVAKYGEHSGFGRGSKLINGSYDIEYLMEYYLFGKGKYIDSFYSGNIMKDLDVAYGCRAVTRQSAVRYTKIGDNQDQIANLIKHSLLSSPTHDQKYALECFKGDMSDLIQERHLIKEGNAIEEFLSNNPLKEPIKVKREDSYAILCNLKFADEVTLKEALTNPQYYDRLTQIKSFEGQSFINDRFMSTTVSEGAFGNCNVNWDLEICEGVGATYLDIFGLASEGELLLNRGLKITIIEIEDTTPNGIVNIKARISKA